MAKHLVSILLAVLAVAVSMHAGPSTVHAAPLEEPAMEFFQEWYTAFKNKWEEDPTEVIWRIKDAVDIGQKLRDALGSGSSDGGAGGTATAPSTQQPYLAAGNLRFTVVAVDITSRVTSTNMCDRSVAATAGACVGQASWAQYAEAAQQPNCGSAFVGTTAPMACLYSTSTALVQGPVALSVERNGRALLGCALYTCTLAAGGGASSAVVGLGRGGTLTSRLSGFSYLLDSNLRTSFWLAHDNAGAAYAPQGRSSTTALIKNRFFPNLYYVSATGIQVGGGPPLQMGSLDFRQDDGTGGVFLSTTVPFTFLNGNLYQVLKREFSAAGRVPSELGRTVDQLCYGGSSADQLPEITLFFADDAVMEVEAGSCWYRQSNGSLCLAILPSPRTTGETVIGTMLQRGRRMSYDLVQGTLTFQTSTVSSTAAVAAAGSGTSPHTAAAAATKPRSAAPADVDKLTAAFPVLGVWVLLLAMIITT